MRYPVIAALLLSGCAAQPTYSPMTTTPAVDTRQECVEHIAKTLAFAQVCEPILDKCLANNTQQCVLFAMLLDRHQPQNDGHAAAQCFEDGNAPISMALEVKDKLPRFTKKLKRYNQKMGN